MLQFNLDVRPQTAQRLRRILETHPDQEAFAQQFIAYQMTELKKAILNLRLDLKDLEARHQCSSADFYAVFSRGEAEDSEDALLWAGLYEMLRDNEARLAEMQ